MRARSIILLIGAAAGGFFLLKRKAVDVPIDSDAQSVPDSGTSSFDNVSTTFFGAILTVATRGYRNNNPGNLRTLPAASAWNGQIGDDNGYAIYDTMADGVRAASKQLQKYAKGGNITIRQIISKWAPPSDNNPTDAYVDYVAKRLSVSPDAQLNIYSELPELCRAIFHYENGADGLNFQDITNWVYIP
jgi:hypothetical protein